MNTEPKVLTNGKLDYSRIVLTHANLKKPLNIVMGTIVAFYSSETDKCTHIFTTGGGVFPVVETIEQLNQLMDTTIKNSLIP